jgi:hypothetical protein
VRRRKSEYLVFVVFLFFVVFLSFAVRVEDKDLAGLAIERFADGFECGEADCPRFSGFKDR